MIYAVLFPEEGVLKIGCSGNRSASVYVSAAKQGARSRGWSTEGAARIWHEAGDLRGESFIQASVAFEWPSVTTGRQSRLSEWFRPDLDATAIAASADLPPGAAGSPGAPCRVEPRRKRRHPGRTACLTRATWTVS